MWKLSWRLRCVPLCLKYTNWNWYWNAKPNTDKFSNTYKNGYWNSIEYTEPNRYWDPI
jgi:hypothetical protein